MRDELAMLLRLLTSQPPRVMGDLNPPAADLVADPVPVPVPALGANRAKRGGAESAA
jgi:hypothetical protein